MIKATYDTKKHILTMKGHAGYAEKGEDIVCAGASTLFCAFLDTLDFLWSEGMLESEPTGTLNQGDAELSFRPKAEYDGICDTVALTVLTGLQRLAARYPENITAIIY